MRGKWNKNGDPMDSNGQSLEGQTFRPKFLHHSPSLRAIQAYNDMPVEGNFQNGIDLCLFTPQKYDDSNISRISVGSDTKSNDINFYDYATLGTLSMTNSASELNSDMNEMGSTVKLVPTKMELSCQTWCSYMSTTLCTICMAAGIGNVYRLPQITFIRGGLPFLVAYLILTILVGLPLLFLELGIGQLAQEGFIKSWKAVPFFKGIGYVKLLAGCLLCLYYPLYMALSLYYVIWAWKGPLPFTECSSGVKITEDGYSTTGKNGQQCLRTTFLKQPFDDPYWYGIFAGLLLVIWLIITTLSFRKTKSYIRSLLILILPTLACYLSLFVKSMMLQNELDSLGNFFVNADWSSMTDANVWYYACIQVFFSSNVGFGSFVTNAGIMYNKVNPFWTAVGYTTINIILGLGSTLMSQSLTRQSSINTTANNGDVAELYLMTLIYDIGSNTGTSGIKTWTVLSYILFLLTGFISMATLTYTLLKAITVESRKKLKWWHASLVFSFVGYILGCLILLQPDFDIVHLLDHYIVGNLILITAFMEILVLLAFYGTERIRSDFEFMLGHILSKMWLLLWWIVPLLLTAIFAWGMITLPLEGIFKEDPSWLYGIGWGVVLTALVFIFIAGICIVNHHDGYTWKDKFKASLKPSNNWGPKDPMSRHNWIQWNTKAQHGERDFTLKRKGTKDYTKSIKKHKKAASQLSTTDVPGVYKVNVAKESTRLSNGSNIYTEVYGINSPLNRVHNNRNGRLKLVSLTDTFDNGDSVRGTTSSVDTFDSSDSISGTGREINNPLALRAKLNQTISPPEEYGTFRKGPYIISEQNIEHVCYKKYGGSENDTEL